MPDLGIGEILAGALIDAGVGEATAGVLGTIGSGALIGAGGGALTSAITGGDPGQGALFGGITGGAAGGIGSALAPASGGAGAAGAAAGGVPAATAAGTSLTDLASTAGAFGPDSAAAFDALGAGATAGGPGAAGGLGAFGGASVAPGTADLAALGGPALPGASGFTTAPGTLPGDVGAGGAGATATLPNLPVSAPLEAGGAMQSFLSGGAGVGGAGVGGLADGAGGGGGTPAAPPGSPPAKPNFITNALTDLGVGEKTAGVIGQNANLITPGLGLLYSAATQGPTAQSKALKNEAQQLQGLTASLTQPLFTGQLPPGAQAAMDSATKSAKASLVSSYASRGMPTDPNMNSALRDELAAIDQRAAGQVFQLADQLLQQGLSAAGLESNIFQALLKDTSANDAALTEAFMNFGAAASGSGTTRVNVGTGR